MFVTFYNRPVKKGLDEAGLPFYQDQVFVIIARDHTNQVDREADQDDFDRFPETWASFQKANDKNTSHEGFLIEMWPMASPSDIANLKAHGFFTVQELAKVTKQAQSKMPPHISVLVNQARSYIAIAGDANKLSEKIDALTSERDALIEENRTLRAQLAAIPKQKDEAA